MLNELLPTEASTSTNVNFNNCKNECFGKQNYSLQGQSDENKQVVI